MRQCRTDIINASQGDDDGVASFLLVGWGVRRERFRKSLIMVFARSWRKLPFMTKVSRIDRLQ